jgi:hypothetical protein
MHPVLSMESRVHNVAGLAPTRSFHPKSWRFDGPRFGVAFVGSSNLSHAALETAIEWNLRVDREDDARAYGRVVEAFEALWTRARPLDAAWIESAPKRRKPKGDPRASSGDPRRPCAAWSVQGSEHSVQRRRFFAARCGRTQPNDYARRVQLANDRGRQYPWRSMANAARGVLHGATITLDAPVPPLDGQRVRVVIEPETEHHDLTPAENAALLREWAKHGPQGPIDDDEDFPETP